MGFLGPTAGESWLAHVGVNDEYPGLDRLTRDVEDAMWEAAWDVLRDHAAADPLLRVMADERCVLWTSYTYRAGDLPAGTKFGMAVPDGNYRDKARVYGRLRPLNKWELERVEIWMRPEDARPVGVDWLSRDGDPARWPEVCQDTEVDAHVPVPLDMSALLAIIDAEQAVCQLRRDVSRPPTPRRPARRQPAKGRHR